MNQLLYRTGDAVAEGSSSVPVAITAAGAVSENLGVLFPKYALKLIGLGAACAAAAAILRRRLLAGLGWRAPLAFLMVAALPYLWYAAAANHSWVHYWFTYRGQLVTVVALGFAALSVIQRLFPGKIGAEAHE